MKLILLLAFVAVIGVGLYLTFKPAKSRNPIIGGGSPLDGTPGRDGTAPAPVTTDPKQH